MDNREFPQGFWHLKANELLSKLDSDPSSGLSEQEACKRLKTYSRSILKGKKKHSALRLLLSQFNSPLIFLLLFCAGLSITLYESTDAFIIFGIVIASGLLSFYQERGALQAVEKLMEIIQINAAVIRQSVKKEIPIDMVVPGDIVELRAGDVIPADCYLLQSKDLFVDEAAMTGETFYAEKAPGMADPNAPLSKRFNSLFMGTHVVSGQAKALVVKVGKETEFGKISGRLAFTPPETEFEQGIRRLGRLLMQMTIYLLMGIFAFNVYMQRPIVESLLFALALAVGLTPQLLPAIISINLAKGAKTMAKNQVIVKRLAAIENFGSMDILCCDKTGTLTTGNIKLEECLGSMGGPSRKVRDLAYLNAAFQTGYANPIDQAILTSNTETMEGWKKIDEVPYDFVRKRLAILVENNEERILIIKGAFHQILDICSCAEDLSGNMVDIQTVYPDVANRFAEYSQKGFRVLGLAVRNGKDISTLTTEDEINMTFCGFLLLSDTPKEGIDAAITELANLGIRLKIITGDNQFMAMNLARHLKIPSDNVLIGPSISHMSDSALQHNVKAKSIFAEVEPTQKERIILALRKSGCVVGFIGDGINDVAALHAADVSITVDNAVDAAKEVADIVLLEKDLLVLKEGVKAGRTTFANTLKYIFMATSANFGNMFSLAGSSLFLNFLPLLPKQVLLTNLMEDFPEMTIATDHVDDEITQKPLRWNFGLIRRFMVVFGLISSFFDYATFGMLIWFNASVAEFRTGWFVESVASAAFIVLIIRTFRPFYASRPSIPLVIAVTSVIIATFMLPFTPLAPYLGFTFLPPKFYLFIFLVLFFYMLLVEAAKRIFLTRWLQKSSKPKHFTSHR